MKGAGQGTSVSRPRWDGRRVLFEFDDRGQSIACAISRGALEELTGLVAAAIAAGLLGYVTSHVIVRFRHLALIMLTLGLGLLLAEAANSAS